MKKIEFDKNIFVIENFWSADRCDEFIQRTEQIGYSAATIETDRGPRVVDFVRNNNRVIYKNVALAYELWQQLEPFAPKQRGNSYAFGLNELFRFYRYYPGQQFRKHRDQSYIRSATEASYFTFMIYLNDDFRGGATTFDHLEVKPKKGTALVFEHSLEHAGSEVVEGVKYVLRTDIMFRLGSH